LYLITLKQKKILFVEDGFIYNVFSHTKSLTGKYPKELTIGMSYTIDDITAHFDGSMPSRLEQIIVSGFEVDSLEIDRVKHLIHSIVENKITKYNYQSLEMKRFGKRKNKILVVDQAYGDYSVYKSGATEQVFLQMLNDALIENQDADILVKVHPDMIANPNRAGAKSGGYFGNMNLDNPRIIIIKEEINPFVILEQVQKVYVCTSQLGFEALMSKKQVIIYGVPFYAGWGITIDRGDIEALQRRKNTKRTLEELFWFSYIWYSRYYDPVLKKECSLESILIQLINMRNKILREEDEK
jgi:capsular polysaccharide export protein